ncbi:AMIN domain-containing protein [Calothrix sp. 336/3]|uniref:AMIN domain-containing protein n=1 Tax=Calothrix sp. 336/3 TaxID=1337936 RepID=UPI0011873847|nr:AMIN domain-containing protein [Calothrix sp. 336/3]
MRISRPNAKAFLKSLKFQLYIALCLGIVTSWQDESSHAQVIFTTPSQRTTQQMTEPIQVTGVKLRQTRKGFEVHLVTKSGQLAVPKPNFEGGNIIVLEIPNAVMALPDGKFFDATQPASGILAVSVLQVEGNRIEVRVKGEKGIPNMYLISGN